MFGLIYKVKNTINGKLYIGQTIRGLEARKKEHVKMDGNDCPALYQAIKKYGIGNFRFDIICYADNMEELNNREIFCIKVFRSKKPNGYNLTDGGGNKNPSQETRTKLSKALTGLLVGPKNGFFGKTHTEEAKKKIGAAQLKRTNRFHSEETKKKISESQKGKIIFPESIEKISKSLKEAYKSPELRSKNRKAQKTRQPVLCHQTGMVYDSVRHAAKELRLPSKDKISCVLKGKYKQYKGYTFSYVKESK